MERTSKKQEKLILLSEELAQKKPNTRKLQKLLKETGITQTNDPFIMTNEVLKRLHSYHEKQND
ncbi:MAG: hypothetical protein HYS98_00010 [Deltaproteobacteria bacterium]|nr:hypothetical protein [Deltaproteobacteria bacterium]